MKNSRNQKHITERLSDRRAYRAALIQRGTENETKLKKVEAEIRELQEARG